VVINTHHLAGVLHAYVADKPGITISHEYTLLDSGGGVRHALPHMGEDPFFVINGDIWWEDAPTPLLHKLADAWQPTMGALLTLVDRARIPLYAGRGDYNLAATGHATHRGAQPHAPYVYGGIALVHPGAYKPFKDGEVFSNKAVWDALEAQGALYGLERTDFWLDIGTLEALAYLNSRPYAS
jgi:MurNAc alpha-1-phosphate uridylyltransferase